MSAQKEKDFRPKDMTAILAIAGIEQAELAIGLNLSQAAISKTLNGHCSKPTTVRNVVSYAMKMIEERAVNSLASAA